jgi:hypothetical protein
MADFMRDKKRAFEWRTCIFVKDETIARNKHRAAPVKDRRAWRGNFNIKSSPLRFSSRKGIGLPRIMSL